MSAELLQTKLYIPSLRSNTVPRSRLIGQLSQGIRLGNKLTLISAPAGFGKTTLLAEWLSQFGDGSGLADVGKRGLAWISLEPEDNDTARFLSYLVAALRKIDPGMGGKLEAMLKASHLPSIESLMTPLINDIASMADPFLLVMDDYHTLTELAVHQIVEFLLEHAPPQMHLVIATRQDPSLPLSRWRGLGMMTEIRQGDLRFTPGEAAAFLNESMALHLLPSEILALDERTEGWIVGLQLAAVSMRGRQDTTAFIDAFTGSNRHILDYLVEEVLKQQPAAVQEFLLQTAILGRLTASLCDAVSDRIDSRAILDQIERSNLFIIPLDDDRDWYRYHHLFAELLQARVQENVPGQIGRLHQRASNWYRQHGFTPEAVHHALESEDVEFAADVIEAAVKSQSTWSSTDVSTLMKWLQSLPDKVVRARPWLGIFLYRSLFVSGEWQAAGRLLSELEQLFQDRPEIPEAQVVMKLVVADQASFAAVQGDIRQAIEYGQRALAAVPATEHAARIRPLSILGMAHNRAGRVAEAHDCFAEAVETSVSLGGALNYAAIPLICNLAEIQRIQGRLHRAAQSCEEAVTLGTTDGHITAAAGFAGVVLAKIYFDQNDLSRAESSLMEGLERLQSGGISSDFGNGYALLAQIKQAQGASQEASSAMAVAVQAAEVENIPRITQFVSACQARIWLAQGDVARALAWAEEFRQLGETEYLREFEEITLAQVLLTNDQPPEAVDELEPMLLAAEAAGRMSAVVEILVLLAKGLEMLGRTEEAAEVLVRALNLAEKEGYVRYFIEGGYSIARLLKLLVQNERQPTYAAEMLRLLQENGIEEFAEATGWRQGADEAGTGASLVVEPLSERELEVLHYLAQGFTNPEIAEKLFLSNNTIRTHTYNIYSKLAVHSRMQAVAKGRELGLLP